MFNRTRTAVVLSVALALTASTGMVAAAQDDETGDKGLICVIVPPLTNPFWIAMQDIAAAKANELGYTTDKLIHDDDANLQLELYESCVAQGAVAIILDNAGADASVTAIQKAKDAGVPSFLVDREINELGVAVAQIISNNYQGATILAEEFARLMDEEGTYIELTGRDTDTNAQIRNQGYHDVLDEIPEMEMVAQETANWQQDEGLQVTETLLQQFPDVKGIIAGNDTMALGAQAAVNAFNPDIIVVGFDGSDEAMISINQGELDATSLQPVADMALQSAIQADAYIQAGGTTDLEEKQSIDMVLINADNACDYYQFAPVEPGTSPNCAQ